MKTLLIADDHQLFREGIVELFDDHKKINKIIEANNGREAIEMAENGNVDIILMDISMPIVSGIDATIAIKEKCPNIKIVMLTMHDTQNYIKKLLKIGVDGYLLKTTSSDELKLAVDMVINNQKYYGKAVQATFISSFNSESLVQDISLTKREKEILSLICNEFSTKEIADKLYISSYTVESHRKNLLAKTGSKNVAGLVRFAIQNKFV
ncbi:MAG: response regulator [Crocinitomicaceae bacterium]